MLVKVYLAVVSSLSSESSNTKRKKKQLILQFIHTRSLFKFKNKTKKLIHQILLKILLENFKLNPSFSLLDKLFLFCCALKIYCFIANYLFLCHSITDRIPRRGVRLPSKGYPGYDTKLHLIVRFQSWISGRVPSHCHYSQVHSDPER